MKNTKKLENLATREDFQFEITANDLVQVISKATSPLPDPIQYQYYKCLSERRILINDQITPNFVETAILPLIQMDNDGTGKPIEIILNTMGGWTTIGMTFCDVIGNLKTPTTITVLSYAYSMGSLILMSGYKNPNIKRRCYKHSTALFHAGDLGFQGEANAVRDQVDFNQTYEKLVREFVLSHSKITAKEYTKMERYQWYMTSDEMVAKGLVDEII